MNATAVTYLTLASTLTLSKVSVDVGRCSAVERSASAYFTVAKVTVYGPPKQPKPRSSFLGWYVRLPFTGASTINMFR